MDTSGYLQMMVTSILMGQTMDISFIYKFVIIAIAQYFLRNGGDYYGRFLKYLTPDTITVKILQLKQYSDTIFLMNPVYKAVINYILENEIHIVDEFENIKGSIGELRDEKHYEDNRTSENKQKFTLKKYAIIIRHEKEIMYKGSSIFVKIFDNGDKEKGTLLLRNKEFTFIDNFCTDCIKIMDDNNKFPLYQLDGDGDWVGTYVNVSKTVDNTFLNKGMAQNIVDDITDFSTKKEDNKLDFTPNKLGFIFYGPPGNGKSSVCYMIANYTKRPIYRMNASDLKKFEWYSRIISEIPPCSILSIDDADLIFAGCAKRKLLLNSTKNEPIDIVTDTVVDINIVTKKIKKTKDDDDDDDDTCKTDKYDVEKSAALLHDLLTIFDGYTYLRDTIVVMTTNKIDDFDPALLRPGRFEHKYMVDNVDEYQIGQIYKHFTGLEMDLTRLKKGLVGLSVSEFLYTHIIPNRKNLSESLLD